MTMTHTQMENPVTAEEIELMMEKNPELKAFLEELSVPAVDQLRCPQCQQSQCFVIEVWSRLMMFKDGVVLHEDRNEVWDDDSYCSCTQCQHSGGVLEFRREVQDYLTENHFGDNSHG